MLLSHRVYIIYIKRESSLKRNDKNNNNNNNMCKSFAIFFLANVHIQTFRNDGKRMNEKFVCMMMFHNPLLLWRCTHTHQFGVIDKENVSFFVLPFCCQWSRLNVIIEKKEVGYKYVSCISLFFFLNLIKHNIILVWFLLSTCYNELLDKR